MSYHIDKITVKEKTSTTFGDLHFDELFVNKDYKNSMSTVWRKVGDTSATSIVDLRESGVGWDKDDLVIKVKVTEIVVEEI